MRSPLLIALFAFIISGFTASAQFTGKPQYNIKTFRAGTLIGDIKLELYPTIAPKHAQNFDSLVKIKFYDTTAFHRVIPGFVIQGGDPNSRSGARSTWGFGDPSQQTVDAEFSPLKHLRGIVSAARSNDINSATSQFFICVATAANLDGKYSAYGKVIDGMSFADNIVNSPRDANDNPNQKIEMFVTYTGSDDAIPNAPLLIAPLDKQENVSANTLLKWTKINGALLYNLDLSTDSNFTDIISSQLVVDTSYKITDLPGFTKIYWRVRANNGGRLSAVTAVRTFTTGSGAAILIEPLDLQTDADLNLNFSWDSVPGATSYRLELSKAANFNPTQYALNMDSISKNNYTVNDLKTNTKYYWRVRSAKDSVEGFYSEVRSFRTTAINSVADIYNNSDFFSLSQNVPNPANSQTSIEYSLSKNATISIKLFDITGKEILTIVNEQQKAAGHYLYLLNTSKLAAGTYFYKLQTGDNMLVKKMIVQ